MLAFLISICLTSLTIGLVIMANRSLSKTVRVLLIILCAIVFIVSGFLGFVMLEGRGTGKGADEFLHIMIENSRSNQYPLIGETITSQEKEQFHKIIDTFPNCDYRVGYRDCFVDAWQYEVHFENDQSYFITIYAPGLFMKLFEKKEYYLEHIEGIKTGPKAR